MEFPHIIAILAAISVAACTTPATATKRQYLARIEASSQVKLGMSKEQVRAILGPPGDQIEQVSAKGRDEVWTYISRIVKVDRVEPRGIVVGFRNGKVMAVSRR